MYAVDWFLIASAIENDRSRSYTISIGIFAYLGADLHERFYIVGSNATVPKNRYICSKIATYRFSMVYIFSNGH